MSVTLKFIFVERIDVVKLVDVDAGLVLSGDNIVNSNVAVSENTRTEKRDSKRDSSNSCRRIGCKRVLVPRPSSIEVAWANLLRMIHVSKTQYSALETQPDTSISSGIHTQSNAASVNPLSIPPPLMLQTASSQSTNGTVQSPGRQLGIHTAGSTFAAPTPLAHVRSLRRVSHGQLQVWYHDDEHDRIAIDSPLDFEAALTYAAQLNTREHPHLNIYVLGCRKQMIVQPPPAQSANPPTSPLRASFCVTSVDRASSSPTTTTPFTVCNVFVDASRTSELSQCSTIAHDHKNDPSSVTYGPPSSDICRSAGSLSMPSIVDPPPSTASQSTPPIYNYSQYGVASTPTTMSGSYSNLRSSLSPTAAGLRALQLEMQTIGDMIYRLNTRYSHLQESITFANASSSCAVVSDSETQTAFPSPNNKHPIVIGVEQTATSLHDLPQTTSNCFSDACNSTSSTETVHGVGCFSSVRNISAATENVSCNMGITDEKSSAPVLVDLHTASNHPTEVSISRSAMGVSDSALLKFDGSSSTYQNCEVNSNIIAVGASFMFSSLCRVPSDLRETQLVELERMGYVNRSFNAVLLSAHRGDLAACVTDLVLYQQLKR